jgi:hypothetical protein
VRVASSWVGTTIPQSAELVKVIRAVLEAGRTVTFAVKHQPAPDVAEEADPTAPLDLPSLRFDDDAHPDDGLDLEDVVES